MFVPGETHQLTRAPLTGLRGKKVKMQKNAEKCQNENGYVRGEIFVSTYNTITAAVATNTLLYYHMLHLLLFHSGHISAECGARYHQEKSCHTSCCLHLPPPPFCY